MAAYVSLTAQRQLRILLPEIGTQRAIANVLGSLDDKIELNRRMNGLLEGMARAIFKAWFIDFEPVKAKAAGAASFSGMPQHVFDQLPNSFVNSELGPIPLGWTATILKDEFRLTMGQSPPGSSYNEDGDGLPFFQGRKDYGIRFPRRRVFCTAPTRFADEGDTLVSVRAPVGAINMASERCCVGRGLASLRHRLGGKSYTYYAIQSLARQFEVYEGEGTVYGSITKKSFEGLSCLCPEPDLVEAFERLSSPLDERFANNVRETNLVSAIRDALLPKLISGEISVSAESGGSDDG